MFFKKKSDKIGAFMEGQLIPLEKVNDPVFSQKMMGDGFAIIPRKGTVVSPVDGEITMIFHTKHALGIMTKDNVEVLLHIGIDTVKLDGEGFELFVKEGDKVSKGDKLIEVNLDTVVTSGKETTSMLILTSGQTVKNLKEQDVSLTSKSIVNWE